jgi:hypothetical protein
MNLSRFIVIGLDPKKPDFAACTFADIASATAAVAKYKKLGVTPIVVDLAKVFAYCVLATPQPNVSLAAATPNAYNPTTFRVPRWLVLCRAGDGSVTYDVDADYAPATSKALGLNYIKAGITSLPPRVDKPVSAPTLDELSLLRQFAVAVMDPAREDTSAYDGVIGIEGCRWDLVGEYDALDPAIAAAKGADGSVVYDRDNDATWKSPFDDPALASRDAYLRFERGKIEEDVREEIDAPVDIGRDDLIKALRSTAVPLRRSGQTGWDRAKELESST